MVRTRLRLARRRHRSPPTLWKIGLPIEGLPTIPVQVPNTFSDDPGTLIGRYTLLVTFPRPEADMPTVMSSFLQGPVCPVAGPGSQTPASPSMAGGASMLTARENQIICRDLQIVGSPSQNARAPCSPRGGRWGDDFLGYVCMRPGPLVKYVFPERRVRRWGLGWAAYFNLAGRVDDPG
ncbi:hypothetical protein B0T18DRAFT_179622 [Schizothecium vesticola]|uniref:Uncharacterized protein n=1 Tax=Schizothecium vesticola TaxID=314040 RepID=A0AA40EPR9_9PEZI|nr:hypothetical protein B0T18DRAFT_179622 [Schizothecium vesticola]